MRERLCKPEVTGSIPVGSTRKFRDNPLLSRRGVCRLHRGFVVLAVAATAAVLLGGLTALGASHADARTPGKACRSGFVRGTIGGKRVCLKSGKRCQKKFDQHYYRFV